MFEQKNHDQDNGLKSRIERLGSQLEPSSELMQAAINGTPLQGKGNRYTPGYHVKKFAKAAIAYAVGVALFLGLVSLLPGLSEQHSPVAGMAESLTSSTTEWTKPSMTDERDQLTSDLSAETRAIYEYVWCVVRDMPQAQGYTINDLKFGGFIKMYEDKVVCYFNYNNFIHDHAFTGVSTVYSETVAGYEFRYGGTLRLSVFADYTQYDLSTAYQNGVLTQDEIRMIWEDYKSYHGRYYEISPDGVTPNPQ